jgi:glutamate dehydrogenase
VPDDPYLARELYRYFPERLVTTHRDTVTDHRLRREVIATVLANAMVNRGGPSFVVAMRAATSADVAGVTAAYAAARDTYGLSELNHRVDLLDGLLPGAVQLGLYAEVEALLRRQTLWFLRNETFEGGLAELVTRHGAGDADIREELPGLVSARLNEAIAARTRGLEAEGVPHELARRFAELPSMALASDVVLVATRTRQPVLDAARAFFGVLATFGLAPILERTGELHLPDRFDRMALDRGLANMMRAQRDLTADVLAGEAAGVPQRLAAWRQARGPAIERTAHAVAELTEGEVTVSRLTVAAGLLSDLARGT